MSISQRYTSRMTPSRQTSNICLNWRVRGEGFSSDALRTWERFSQQLHNHSTAEDNALWPRVRKLAHVDDHELLDWMEAEHALIAVSLAQVGSVFEECNGV